MNANDYKEPIGGDMGATPSSQSPSNVSTVTVNAVQSVNEINNHSLYNVCNGVTGSWGAYTDSNMEVAYLGKMCIWKRLGSGTRTIDVPVNNSSDYLATVLLKDGGCYGVLVYRGLSQITITQPENTVWQVTGMFNIISKEKG